MKHFALLLATALLFGSAAAETLAVDASFDRWMYPFNGTPGSRGLAPTFGAPGSHPGFDEYDAQYVFGFQGGLVPSGATANQIQLNSVRIVATHAVNNGLIYDGSFDSAASLRDGSAFADGIPVELFGVGYRNGFDSTSWGETSAFGSGVGAGTRNAFAMDFDAAGIGRDVSNAFGFPSNGNPSTFPSFERNPFAVGSVAGLSDGDTVDEFTAFTFNVDLSNPAVATYIAAGLAWGDLRFSLASLHAASQPGAGGSTAYPQWLTTDSAEYQSGDLQLFVDYTVVPEPAATGLALLVLAPLTRRRRT